MRWKKGGGGRKKIPMDGFIFDSEEEVEFYYWLKEALNLGFISEFEHHSNIYKLISKSKVPCSTAIFKQGYLTLQDCEYELDFRFKPTLSFEQFYHKLIPHDDGWIYVDTKGDFKGGDTVFSIKQKLMYVKYNIYVNRVVPLKFFGDTWRPVSAGLTKVKKEVQKKYQHLKTYKQLFGG